MRDAAPTTVYLKDYKAPDFGVEHVDLDFDIRDGKTVVKARLLMVRQEGAAADAPLVLDGENLTLKGVKLDGQDLGEDAYNVTDTDLTIGQVPDKFVLETEVEISPETNTSLQGLYKAGGTYTTQCESQGFRNITYYPDRPDVQATFTTKVTADKGAAPVLLSNGDPIEQGETEDGRHYAVWHDPTPKPSYLFALVGGDLNYTEDKFTTMSGRDVQLRIYAEPGKEDRCHHAMDSLKRSFKWDEDRFGREYQGNVFNVVAVSAFNSGAMENTTLNIFNDQVILADPETATDSDYLYIERVIGHEYFHNWSGNRVTCRDWFQLSLKEGFTVFRDQEFSTDVGGSPNVQRIIDVETLRASQFPEDAGPTAHPIRPESYIQIRNFYTPTVYKKGAEVIRMMETLLGKDSFRAATDLYFDRHDGTAATCEDFVQAMEDASGRDLSQFRLWYSQAGTPTLTTSGDWDAETGTYRLTVKQHVPPTPGQPDKQPMHLPLRLSLFGPDGKKLPMHLRGSDDASGPDERVLEITQSEQVFEFTGLDAEPTPSLLRKFSAPVKLESDLDGTDLAFLMKHDDDPFNKWEAAQKLSTETLLAMAEDYKAGQPMQADRRLMDGFADLLNDRSLDRGLLARILSLPSEQSLALARPNADPDAIHAARQALKQEIAIDLGPQLEALFEESSPKGSYTWNQDEMARRALRNTALGYLMTAPDGELVAKAAQQFGQADNMTERMGALANLVGVEQYDAGQRCLDAFEARFKDDPLVMDKWLGVQARSSAPNTVEKVRELMQHPAFDIANPNRVRALVGAFAAGNPSQFHRKDGAGYKLLADTVIALDKVNSTTASRQLAPMRNWAQYEPKRQEMMKSELRRILAEPGLSADVYEIASKSLGEDNQAKSPDLRGGGQRLASKAAAYRA